MNITPEAFDALVDEVLDEVPGEMLRMLDNVVFLVEDEPGPEHRDPGVAGDEGGELLGVYLGIPQTERDGGWFGALPDRIILFRGPLTRMCTDLQELREEILVTVVHEAAHHLGISEERLHELGWG